MARLNDPQSESLEALKKRYLRQNREIARVNSTQSVRIRSLESETTRLLAENIALREQVIKLQASLDRRDKTRFAAENVESTQKKMQKKIEELNELVTSLGAAVVLSPQGKSTQKTSKTSMTLPDLNSRPWKTTCNQNDFSGNNEGHLPSIDEDRRSSLNFEDNRRSSINFEDIMLPPPKPEEYVREDSDEEQAPVSHIESRSKRRRDSSAAQDLETSTRLFTSSKAQTTLSSNVTGRAPKRKFSDKDLFPSLDASPDIDFKFTMVPDRAVESVRRVLEGRDTVMEEDPIAEEVAISAPNTETGDYDHHHKFGSTSTSRKKTSTSSGEGASAVTTTASAASTAGRRALGPKSTNLDPANSPMKQISVSGQLLNEKFEKSEKLEKLESHPPPTTKTYRGSNVRDKDTPPPEVDPAATTAATGRAARRARASVNYALPNLRNKMRREETGYVDAVTGEGKVNRRSTISSKSARKKDDGDAVHQRVMDEDHKENGENAQWMNLPRMYPKTSEPVDSADEPQKTRNPASYVSMEKKERREREGNGVEQPQSEPTLPSSVTTQRKRRSSNLHVALSGLDATGVPERQSEVPTSSAEEEPRSREARRRSRNSLPSSSIADDEEPASKSRRATIGGDKRVRISKSIHNYGNDDEGGITPSGSSRRMSMML